VIAKVTPEKIRLVRKATVIVEKFLGDTDDAF
jgi:GMP synthase PP-ATPase subunit